MTRDQKDALEVLGIFVAIVVALAIVVPMLI
jgi:hypothetical protein